MLGEALERRRRKLIHGGLAYCLRFWASMFGQQGAPNSAGQTVRCGTQKPPFAEFANLPSSLQGACETNAAPPAFIGFGDRIERRFMISDMTIQHVDDDHMIKEQRVLMADGTGVG